LFACAEGQDQPVEEPHTELAALAGMEQQACSPRDTAKVDSLKVRAQCQRRGHHERPAVRLGKNHIPSCVGKPFVGHKPQREPVLCDTRARVVERLAGRDSLNADSLRSERMSRRKIGQEELAINGIGQARRSSLDELTNLIDWAPVAQQLDGIHSAKKGEPAWPPLALFKAL
jgi:hypothetical protein